MAKDDDIYTYWLSSSEFDDARRLLEKCIHVRDSQKKQEIIDKINDIINSKKKIIETAISQKNSNAFAIMVQAISGGYEEKGREYFNRDFLNYMLNLKIDISGPYLFNLPEKHPTGILPELMSDFGKEVVISTYIGDQTAENKEIFNIYEDIISKTNIAIDDLAHVLKQEYYTKMSVEDVKTLIQSKTRSKIEGVAKMRICPQKRF